ncbi:MAG: helix-turn-helix domain-containing protein, partial [Pseudomonadota bacterium]
DGQRHIAKALGVSVATLRRRLEAENTSFRRLRAKALNARAQHLLSTRASLSDVAEILGFADLRSFSRAYKAWNGVTPKTQRQLSI